jgi:hypothetical protein
VSINDPGAVTGVYGDGTTYQGGYLVSHGFVYTPDRTPPLVAVSVTPSSLWPPNGKMVPVTVSGAITDSGSGIDPASVRFAVNDSQGRVQPSGNVSVGPDGSYAFTLSLEASRDGNNKSGRTYTLSISARDLAGNAGSNYANVTVPHSN